MMFIARDLADALLLWDSDTGWSLAIDLLEDILDRKPNDDALLARLAEAYARLGNVDTGIAAGQPPPQSNERLKQPCPGSACSIVSHCTVNWQGRRLI